MLETPYNLVFILAVEVKIENILNFGTISRKPTYIKLVSLCY